VRYWDTSALLKLYVAESDSGVFLALASATPRLVTAFIGKHEARAAFHRRETEKVLSPGGGDACYQKLIQDINLGRLEVVPECTPLEDEFGRILAQCLSQSPTCGAERRRALRAGRCAFTWSSGQSSTSMRPPTKSGTVIGEEGWMCRGRQKKTN